MHREPSGRVHRVSASSCPAVSKGMQDSPFGPCIPWPALLPGRQGEEVTQSYGNSDAFAAFGSSIDESSGPSNSASTPVFYGRNCASLPLSPPSSVESDTPSTSPVKEHVPHASPTVTWSEERQLRRCTSGRSDNSTISDLSGSTPCDEDHVCPDGLQRLTSQMEAAMHVKLSFKDSLKRSFSRQRSLHHILMEASFSRQASFASHTNSNAHGQLSGDLEAWNQGELSRRAEPETLLARRLLERQLSAALSTSRLSSPPHHATVAALSRSPGISRVPSPDIPNSGTSTPPENDLPSTGGPRLCGLALTVGSQLPQGEWNSQGGWMLKTATSEATIPPQLQQILADDLVKVRELGRGCFGSVWLAKWRGCEVALKELLKHGRDCPPLEVFAEAEKLAALRHPCIITCYGIVAQVGSYGTVVEYVRHGSLRSALQELRQQGLGSRAMRAAIMLQAARGVEYLHSQFVVHFDLKCDNLLCDLRDPSRPIVKIGDLGLSKKKADSSFISGNMRGTLPWMAPELFPSVREAVGQAAVPDGIGLGDDRVNEKVDVFSFGICLWEAWMLGMQPYPGVPLSEIFAGVMTGTLRPDIPEGCDPEWAALMQDCWQACPRLRPSFSEISDRLDAMVERWTAEEATEARCWASAPLGCSFTLARPLSYTLEGMDCVTSGGGAGASMEGSA